MGIIDALKHLLKKDDDAELQDEIHVDLEKQGRRAEEMEIRLEALKTRVQVITRK